ncbi:MAG: hypothetical protein F6J93_32290 [Oscillatoria sp. SIO1A7]|nr:hypothetical protein [Oscillatoria sp. SIO1A7]
MPLQRSQKIPSDPETISGWGIIESYRGRDPGRRGDSIPETAYATKEDDCLGMRGPHKPMQPTDRAPARKITKNIPLKGQHPQHPERQFRRRGDRNNNDNFGVGAIATITTISA